jgi:hypothetical protein
VYYKTWVIKVEGLTQAAMDFIRQDIMGIMGVMHIVPSKRMEEIGEWKIMVDQTKCSYIHRHLTEHWTAYTAKIPQETLDETPTNFSTPTISSKRAREYQDNESDDDSYGSLLTTGTEMSVMTNEDGSLNELPAEYKYPSYAAAATNTNKSCEDTQVSSPTTSTNTDWQKEKQILEEQIQNQAALIEKIQADLEAKISRSQDLEDKLAKAIELAHTRDVRHEEQMLQKVEQMMKLQTSQGGYLQNYINNTYTTAMDDDPPTTPDRGHLTENLPPPKKANTNTSPNRNIYSLFRQPTGKQTQTRPTVRTKPRKTSTQNTQPMETDEAPHPPTPEAQSGQQKE